jgi:hypothetical protein
LVFRITIASDDALLLSRSLEVRRLPGRPAAKRICEYMPGLPSAAGLRKLAGHA